MAEAARTLVTVAEFLAFEGEPDRRYELVGGEIVAMAPPTGAHGLLVARLARAFGEQLERPCEPRTEAGIALPWSDVDFFVADLVVSCERDDLFEAYTKSPIVICEVLSPATSARDRTVKLVAYRRLSSVRHVLLLRADRPSVEHYARTGRFWRLWDLGSGDVIRLEDLGVELALDELYEGLPVETAAEPG
ncbi:MAG: Uma2 family endonuclease [Geminicoccaceae bacterium]